MKAVYIDENGKEHSVAVKLFGKRINFECNVVGDMRLLTADGNEFITADNNTFLVKGE